MSGHVELKERLLRAVRRERRASAKQLRDVHALPLGERVEAGESMRGLELARRGADGTLHLKCGENRSRFRAGDPLWLSDGERPRGGLAVAFRDHDPAHGTVTVEPDRYQSGARVELSGSLVLDRREIDLSERQLQAVAALFSDPAYVAVRRLLEGAPPLASTIVPLLMLDPAFAVGLDDDQAGAFAAVSAAGAPAIQLVQGPPGAGKTRLAAAMVAAAAAAGKRVLVTAFTHRAVNNVLAAVLRRGHELPVIKIGAASNADDLASLGVRLVPTAARLPTPPALEPGSVVGVTTHAAVALFGRRFDLVLVDEAGQVSVSHACSILPLGDRLVLIGDHRQLPPLVVAEHPDPIASRSIFEHLAEHNGARMLTRTYRMNAELTRFPSDAFYGGKLRAADQNAAQRLSPAIAGDPVLAPDPPGVIVPMHHLGARILAPREAEIAADLVARAIEAGLDPAEVAVIAPHRAQGTRIRALLRERLPQLAPAQQPLVDTVERLQGGERDLIVLSLTASDPDAVRSEAEFFFSPNRLNVSLTRARKKLVVLMSPALLDAFPDAPAALRGADLLRRMWRAYPHVEIGR